MTSPKAPQTKHFNISHIDAFNKRFNRAINGELRRLKILNPSTMLLRLSTQDEGRGFDWIDLELEICGVNDARFVDKNQLSFLDMSEGISILFDDKGVIVCIGNYSSFDGAHNAPLYIRGSTLKYQENSLSA